MLVLVAVVIWSLVFVYFGYSGMVTQPNEGDSLAYHLPIAQMIGAGSWMDRSNFLKPFYFYPAMGETFLSGIMKVGLPANWFNWLGWIMWSGIVYGLLRMAGLGRSESVIGAVGVVMWPSVVRLIPNQTVDIWMGVWWAAAARQLLLRGRSSLWAGIFLGILSGTKVSGLLFSVVLWLVLSRSCDRKLWAAWVVVGGFWYIRNLLLTGNPIYPASVFGFVGDPNFHLMDWSVAKTLSSFAGWRLWSSALMSEYLGWMGLLVLPLWLRNKWTLLGLLNLGVYLLLPSWPQNIVSDLRYAFVVFLPLTVAMWKEVKKRRLEVWMGLMTICMAVMELTQLDFRPKLFVVGLAISGWVLYRRRVDVEKFLA